ncbi:hypothetical protein G6F57_023653 [Rhizopus arrhizus]|nr:hypothetical protein G6F57_023653 [Rhizopus arrhizus]
MGQRDQAVKPQVGRFADDALGHPVFGGHDQLRGFFADLLQEGIGAFGQQLGGIRRRGVAAVFGAAGFQRVGDACQDIGGA